MDGGVIQGGGAELVKWGFVLFVDFETKIFCFTTTTHK